tara:strand:- start:147 stop:977 length:831 start_codon:yes stop_codon:yes gene_type:complete
MPRPVVNRCDYKYDLTIKLATQDLSIDDISKFSITEFKDPEDFEAIHRFNWIRYFLSEKNLNYNSIEYIKSSIEHWCKYYVVDQNIKKSLIWSSYTNSERIVNIIMFYKCINEEPKNHIKYSLDVMSNHLINNLECFNNLHGNHIINNFRALIIYSSFSSNNKLLELSYRYLCDFIDSFIYNGFTKDYSSHYHLLLYFWLKDILIYCKTNDVVLHTDKIKQQAESLYQNLSLFIVNNDILFLGDISPDYPAPYLLTLDNDCVYQNKYSMKNLYSRL